jgi:hypothetical protein
MILSIACSKSDYYSEIKKDCNPEEAEKILNQLLSKQHPQAINVIDAMVDCNSDQMERYLSDIYTRSNENIKRHIFLKLTNKKSRAFLEVAFNILLNKVQTNENYESVLKYINDTDPEFLNRKYIELTERIEEAKKNKNKLNLEILLENIKALSVVIGKKVDEAAIKKDLKAIKEDGDRDELYNKFIDATNNQELTRAYNIFKKLKDRNLILKNDTATIIEELLAQMSETEDKFYETASRLDKLMIEIEKSKREGKAEDVKRLERDLSAVKSDMVFKKRALDRAAKRLEKVRELFEKVKVK